VERNKVALYVRSLLLCCFLWLTAALSAQVRFTGYLQPQFQYGERYASLKVGAENDSDKSFNRTGIRRGRFNLIYEEGLGTLTVQIDVTERGVMPKNALFGMKDPWMRTSSAGAGLFEPPFGKETDYSSSRRESPESSRLFQTLFPEERDMGALLRLRAPESSPLHFLMLDAAIVAGNGIHLETDNRKDVITHLFASKEFGSNLQITGGVSYYNGGVYQGTNNVYFMQGNTFALNDNPQNAGRFAKREYKGIDIQVYALNGAWGRQMRVEFVTGAQPGRESDSKSGTSSTRPEYDTYLRNFRGGYAIFVQKIASTPFSAVVKYEWYDPNTAVAKNDIGNNGTSATDIQYNTLGAGMLWEPDSHFRLQAYYEFNRNERSSNLDGYENDRKDNVLTIRFQYRF